MDLSFILNHLGEEREKYFYAVAPPIIQSSNFCFPNVKTMRESFLSEIDFPLYTRGANPTVTILRKKIAALENSEDALVFGSGVAAISAAVISNVKAGDHIICIEKPYSWTNKLIGEVLKRFGVESSFIDGTEIENFEKSIQKNTALIYLESPNSITLELQDLKAVSALAKKNSITTICDNSYCSPLLQSPINLGIDIVVHSASKYLGGHSDMVAGVLCARKEIVQQIFSNEFMTFGGIISPNDAWLIIRSLRTLPLRIERSSQSAVKIVNWLESHSKVERVIYPFSKSHPQYNLAKKQMTNGGGMFSLLIKAKDISEVELFANSLKRFLFAVSWGGHESLALPVCALPNTTLPFNLLRFYIGLEDPELLMEDINQAFDKI